MRNRWVFSATNCQSTDRTRVFWAAWVRTRCQGCLSKLQRSDYWLFTVLVFRSLWEDLKPNMTLVFTSSQKTKRWCYFVHRSPFPIDRFDFSLRMSVDCFWLNVRSLSSHIRGTPCNKKSQNIIHRGFHTNYIFCPWIIYKLYAHVYLLLKLAIGDVLNFLIFMKTRNY